MRRVRVPLGKRGYDILIGENLLPGLGAHCSRLRFGKRALVISDKTVARLYGSQVVNGLAEAGFEAAIHAIPAGEQAKSLENVQVCYERCAKHRLERNSFIVALGGGVVGDLAGFVAATYLRGINFVQAPTTLLAQVDSSVGGKVGVNLPAGKNLVGAFYQPKLVLCDIVTLKTMEEREYRSGLAEVIKYGIIYDAKLFGRLEKSMDRLMRREEGILSRVIERSCAIKGEVVRQDETEGGLRAILNFGHTIGHALEAISQYGKYLHGEAIAIGQMAAARLSQMRAGLSASDVRRIKTVFESAGLPTEVVLSGGETRDLLNAMKLDKKVSNGIIKFVLAEKIGKVKFGCEVPEKSVLAALTTAHGRHS
jgi:3-dehydroquinate synthase